MVDAACLGIYIRRNSRKRNYSLIRSQGEDRGVGRDDVRKQVDGNVGECVRMCKIGCHFD